MFVTIVDKNFYKLVNQLVESIRQFHNEPIAIYDIGLYAYQKKELKKSCEIVKWGMVKTKKKTQKGNILCQKPYIILDALKRFGRLCFLDADTKLLKSVNYLLTGDFWLAVTERPDKEKYRKLNSGVEGVNRRKAVRDWIAELEKINILDYDDQVSLENLVYSGYPNITILPCEVWNWWGEPT